MSRSNVQGFKITGFSVLVNTIEPYL